MPARPADGVNEIGTTLRLSTLVIARSGERLLLLRRSKRPNLGLWSPPGGMIEPGEDPLESAAREFREETGLELVDPELAVVVSEVDEASGEMWLMFVYRGKARGAPQSDHREGRAGWVRARDVPRLPRPPADGAILAAAARLGFALLRVTMRSGRLVEVSSVPVPYPGRSNIGLPATTGSGETV